MCFGEVLTAMITPMREDGSVNYDKACELALHLLNNGSDGLVIGGTTGESPTLSEDETITLYREVKNAVGDKGYVIGGAGSNSTAAVVERIKKCNHLSLDGYLSIVPYYNKPTPEGVYRHFQAVAAAAECPVMLYNVPARTGLKMDTATIVRLAELNNIKAVKESTGSVDDFSELKRELPEAFSIYSGDDYMTLPAVALGATGVVSVASHLVGTEIKEMVGAVKNNQLVRARELHLYLYPLMKGLFTVANPIPVKIALNLLGFGVGGFRLPICEPEAEVTEMIRNLLNKYELLP